MQNRISTERLDLDRLTLDDFEFITTLVNTKGWIEFIGDRNVHSKEDAINYINKILSSENLFYWVARTKEKNTPIGIVTFIKRTYLNHFDIGFAFLPEFNGCGYAYEAAKEVYSISRKNHDTILATTLPQNESSIKLLRKLGLDFEKEIEVDNDKLHMYSSAKQFT